MTEKKFDISVIGHFSVDSIILPNRSTPVQSLGGAVTYVSIISKRLNQKVTIVSKIGKDFPKKYLEMLNSEGIDLSYIKKEKNEKTTHFEIKYSKKLSNRKLRLKNKTSPIDLSSFPKNLNSKIIHLAPIVDEISFEIAKKFRKQTNFLSLDPQGLVRKFSKDGFIELSSKPKIEILSLVDIFKASINEIKTITGLSNLNKSIKSIHDFGVNVVIVTLGSKGAIISDCGTKYYIPAYKPKKFVDPTGAGDCFIGGFLSEFQDKKDILWCAYVGSAAASVAIEKVGSSFLDKKEEIYQRAYAIYEKERRII
jgi:sugar/nucleoside kinase (ribokinase family)